MYWEHPHKLLLGREWKGQGVKGMVSICVSTFGNAGYWFGVCFSVIVSG